MDESKRLTKPLCEQTLRSLTNDVKLSFTLSFACTVADAPKILLSSALVTFICVCFSAPFEFKNSLERLTVVLPFQCILSLFSSVTLATTVDSRFSFRASCINLSASFALTTTAILSWDSEIASSVPSRPSYFFGTFERSMSSPSASSPMATEIPPAPKSLQRRISVVASFDLNSLCNFLSSGGLPFCTSAPHFTSDSAVCALEEPVEPPQPSRPVLPPRRITTSPSSGTSLITFSAGAAPTTAPISSLFAT